MPEFKCNLCGVEFDNQHECSVRTLKQQNQKMRRALEFYADTENYKANVVDQWEPVIPVDVDSGKIARNALENQ